jgi:hypothetical protein
MKHIKPIKTNLFERGISHDEAPETYLAGRSREAATFKTYAVGYKECMQMFKELRWQDITWIEGTGSGFKTVFPLLPNSIREKIHQLYRANASKTKEDFCRGSLSFAKTIRPNEDPTTSNAIHMQVEGSQQRSHFPNNGIPPSLLGVNLGYKLYRSLLEKFHYLTSNTGGTVSKDMVWQSLVSQKLDASGNPTADDVHAIVASTAVFAMIKNIPDAEKIQRATAFINSGSVNKDNITSRNFIIDPELKAILPKALQLEIDPVRRAEAAAARAEQQRIERKAAEAAAIRSAGSRFELYAPGGVDDHSWEIGDYIVLRTYLMDVNYNVPVRKVVEKKGNEWIALKISDLASYEATGAINDPRKTTRKTDWVKSQWVRSMPGYITDPTAGRTAAAPGVTATRRAPGGGHEIPAPTPTRRPRPGQDAIQPLVEMTPTQRRTINSFMRDIFMRDADGLGIGTVYVRSDNWDTRTRFATQKRPMDTFLVKKIGTGRSATYTVMNARTAAIQANLTPVQFEGYGLKKLNATQLQVKGDVVVGDWVFVKERKSMGVSAPVQRVTPRSNAWPGVYIEVGEHRPQHVQTPDVLYKLTPASNESIATSLYRFGELNEAEIWKSDITTKDMATEVFTYLEENGEHALVREYKGKISDDDISHVIQAWATTVEPLSKAIDDFCKRHKIN